MRLFSAPPQLLIQSCAALTTVRPSTFLFPRSYYANHVLSNNFGADLVLAGNQVGEPL